jgi:hypothetical protein
MFGPASAKVPSGRWNLRGAQELGRLATGRAGLSRRIDSAAEQVRGRASAYLLDLRAAFLSDRAGFLADFFGDRLTFFDAFLCDRVVFLVAFFLAAISLAPRIERPVAFAKFFPLGALRGEAAGKLIRPGLAVVHRGGRIHSTRRRPVRRSIRDAPPPQPRALNQFSGKSVKMSLAIVRCQWSVVRCRSPPKSTDN